MSTDSLQGIPVSFASCSIGCRPEHTLLKKLDAISSAGFTAIELAFPDLQAFASAHLGQNVDASDYDRLCLGAEEVKKQCQARGLKVLILQPFTNFEGWPRGSKERKEAFDRARGWIRIMRAVGTDILQVGSSDSPNITSNRDELAKDLKELAELLNAHSLRLAYENWCWATHCPSWEDVWDIVQRVNMPNVGLCLDTFQTAGGEWGDPTTISGQIEQSEGLAALEKAYEASLSGLSRTVPPEKIYLLQVSDAYKPPKPFDKEVDSDGTRPRGRWSHDFRPLPYDGGYLPIVAFAKAVLRTGFRGWFSIEVFDSGSDGKGRDYDDLSAYARKAMSSQRQLLRDCSQ